MIKIINLCKKFDDKTVLDNINFEIKDNIVSCIKGETGRGKTTLINILLGITKQDSGEIITSKKLKYSIVFQENRLIEDILVYHNLSMVTKDRDKIENYLEQFDLFEHKDKKTKTLSGGMKRKIAIIRSLLVDFDVLILDEPFTGIDDNSKFEIIKYIKNLGKTTIFISHNSDEIEKFADEIIIL